MDGGAYSSNLIRDFIAAWRRGDSTAAAALKGVAEYYYSINPAVFTAFQTICDVEMSVPFGSPIGGIVKEIHA